MFTPAIVVDTNVFVASGFNADSHSRLILDAVRTGELVLVWNDATRRETEAVVDQIPPLSIEDVEPLFTERGRYDHPTRPDEFAEVDDPSDRKFAALARAAGAVLVTNDDDLLGPRNYLRITVVTPREYVDNVGHIAR